MNYCSQRGYILVPAIFMLALLAVTAYFMTTDGLANLKLGNQQAETQRARYVAAAGLAHAEWVASRSGCSDYSLAATTFVGDSYSATFAPTSGSPVNILSTAVLADGGTASVERANVTAFDETTINTQPLQPGVGLADAYTWKGSREGRNFGAATILSANNAGDERTSLLRFDLSMIPAGSTITSAKLQLYLEGGDGLSNGVLDVHRLTRSWVEGIYDDQSPPAGGGVTYLSFDGQTNWSNPGGDFDPTPVASVTIPALTPGWYTWNVASLVDAWVRGSEVNDGFLLRASGGTVENIEFASGDSATTAIRPRLIITYTCECGTSCAPTPPPACEADYTPMSVASSFSTAAIGAQDVQAITYLPQGTVFNGVWAPAGGAWVLINPFDDRFYMTDMAGLLLTTMDIPVADVTGGVYVNSGLHGDELALTTSNGTVVFVDMLGNTVSSLVTSDFAVDQPAAIGFVSSSDTFSGHLLVLDSSDETVTIIDQAGTEQGTIGVDDGDVDITAQDVKHLPGSDKFMVTYDCCSNVIFDFSGAELRNYDVERFGATATQASAIQPLTCEHVVAEGDADKLLYLSQDAPNPYVETFQTWASTQPGNWQTWALGVPADAVAEVAIVNTNEFMQVEGGVRAVGSSLDRTLFLHEAQSGGSDVVSMHVQADAAGRIEHYAERTGDLTFVLLGYWTVGTYVEAWQTFTAGTSGSWRDHSLNAYGVGAGQVAEIVTTNTDASRERQAGVRSSGSSTNRRYLIHEAEGGGVDANTLIVNAGSDTDATVEVYAASDSMIEFHLAGYWSAPPGTYVEAAASGSASAAGVWTTVDLSSIAAVPARAVVSTIVANTATKAEKLLGVRETGSALDRRLNLQEAEGKGADLATLHVNTDTSSSIQWRAETDYAHAFHITGWWDLP